MIALWDCNFQAGLKFQARRPPNPLFFGGGGILKVKIEIFNRDCLFLNLCKGIAKGV